MLCGDRKQEEGHGHHEMTRMGGKTEICNVRQGWLLLDLVSAIKFSGLFFNFRVVLLDFCHVLHLVSTQLPIGFTNCCITVQLLLTYINGLVYSKIS